MRHVAATARIVGLVFIALVSVGAGALLLWGWLDPQTIAAARTIELFCVLALLFLPVATVALAEMDRRSRPTRARRAAAVFRAAVEEGVPAACEISTFDAADERRRLAALRDRKRSAAVSHAAHREEGSSATSPAQAAQRPAGPDRSARARSRASSGD